MSNLQAISRQRHASQRWGRYSSYRFAAHDAWSILTAQELPKAMLHLPIAFTERNGVFVPVALLGLNPGKNLFVTREGRWVGGYIPASYRHYPFVLANTNEGRHVLCFNEDSGLLASTDGELFFGPDDQPSPAVAEVLTFLNQLAANHQVTERACAVLQKHNLIQPWAIKIQDPNGEQGVDGLFQIDEVALNQLPAEALIELRNASALVLAYCQLLSKQHLPSLGHLVEAHAKADAPLSLKNKNELDLSFLEGSETLKFF